MLRYKTRQYFTSGGKEYVPDGRPGHHSPFAFRLIDALRRTSASGGILTLAQLKVAVERLDPQPRAGAFGDDEPGGDFLFVTRYSAELPAPYNRRLDLAPLSASLRPRPPVPKYLSPMLRIAVSQFRPTKGEYAQNVDRIAGVLGQAMALEVPPALVVFPETATSGHFVEGGVKDVAVTAGTLFRDLQTRYEPPGAPPVDVAVGFYDVFTNNLFNSYLYIK